MFVSPNAKRLKEFTEPQAGMNHQTGDSEQFGGNKKESIAQIWGEGPKLDFPVFLFRVLNI